MLSWEISGLEAQTWPMLETHTAKTEELLTFQRHQSWRSQNSALDRLISENQAKVGGTFSSAELTSFTCLAGVAAVTLAVCLPQAWHLTLAMFTVREATGIGAILVLLITQNTRMTRLAAAGVRVRVDWKAGAMDTPEDGDTSKVKIEKRLKKIKWILNRTEIVTQNTHLLPSHGLLTCWSHSVPVQPGWHVQVKPRCPVGWQSPWRQEPLWQGWQPGSSPWPSHCLLLLWALVELLVPGLSPAARSWSFPLMYRLRRQPWKPVPLRPPALCCNDDRPPSAEARSGIPGEDDIRPYLEVICGY